MGICFTYLRYGNMLRKLLTVLLTCSLVTTISWMLFSADLSVVQSLIENTANTDCTDFTTIPKRVSTRPLPQARGDISQAIPLSQASWASTYMELKVKARLGNQLFAYAALRQFSSLKNSTPIILPDHEDISQIFKIKPTPQISVDRSSFVEVPEMRRDLEGTLSQIQQLQPANISFVGFYQSPKFFEAIRQEIREEYMFRDHISSEARRYLRSIVPDPEATDFVQVAIHVRRTDHVSYKFIEQLGFNFPPESYFKLAMDYFKEKHSQVQFIVASDDIPWCRMFFRSFHEDIKFSENHNAEVDLAIMSYCDHSIITIGTFSWWVGWLCKGSTIYYANYNRRPSWVSMVLSPSHYIPEDEHNNWIALRHKDDRSMFKRKLRTESEWQEIHNEDV